MSDLRELRADWERDVMAPLRERAAKVLTEAERALQDGEHRVQIACHYFASAATPLVGDFYELLRQLNEREHTSMSCAAYQVLRLGLDAVRHELHQQTGPNVVDANEGKRGHQ